MFDIPHSGNHGLTMSKQEKYLMVSIVNFHEYH